MTFTEIKSAICKRVNYTSTDDDTRVGELINIKYRAITASLGIKHVSRRVPVSASFTPGVSTLQFTNAEKVVNVFNRNVSPYKQLDEVTIDELEKQMPFTASDTPTQYAIKQMAGDSVTILVNVIPQTAFALYADVYAVAGTLSGTDEPVFSESYHDILISAVLIDEYMKLEKPKLSQVEYARVYGEDGNGGRLSQLRHWVAVSTTKKLYQNKDNESTSGIMAGGTGGGSSVNGALSYEQTGLVSFNRGANPPYAVNVGATRVDNLVVDPAIMRMTGQTAGDLLVASSATAWTRLAAAAAGKILRAAGAGVAAAWSTFTMPDTYAQGDLLYASATNTFSALAKNTSATRYLSNTGASNNPAWAQIDLSNGVTGDLPYANLAQGSALSVLGVTGNSTADNASIAAGSDFQVLRRSGTSVAFGAIDLSQSAATTNSLLVARLANGVTTRVTITATGTNNNYAPGLSGDTFIYCNNASLLTITGFAGGVDGQLITLVAANAQVDFAHNSGSSSAGNKLFNIATSAATSIAGFGYAQYRYNSNSQLWHLVAHDQGAWISPSYSAGNFTASSGTWTVDSGDINAYSYRLVGRTLHVNFNAAATDVSATPVSLQVAIPGGFTNTKACSFFCRVGDAGTFSAGYAVIVAASTNVLCRKIDASGFTTTAADNTSIEFNAIFEVT